MRLAKSVRGEDPGPAMAELFKAIARPSRREVLVAEMWPTVPDPGPLAGPGVNGEMCSVGSPAPQIPSRSVTAADDQCLQKPRLGPCDQYRACSCNQSRGEDAEKSRRKTERAS